MQIIFWRNEHIVFLQTRDTLLRGVKWESWLVDSPMTTDGRVSNQQRRY